MRHQIEGVAQEVSELEASLSAAKQAEDGDEVSFLCDRLKQLDKEKVALREKENLLLRAQQGGGNCSLLPPSAHSCYLEVCISFLLTFQQEALCSFAAMRACYMSCIARARRLFCPS